MISEIKLPDTNLNQNVILETERLILRKWQESDAPALYAIAKDPDIGPNAGWLPHGSLSYSRTVIRTIYVPKPVFAIIPKAGTCDSMGRELTPGVPIGSVSLALGPTMARGVRAGEAELGYWLGKPYWNTGFIREAANRVICYGFCNLNLVQMWCAYYKGNDRSRRVMKHLGFYWHHTIRDSYNPMLKSTHTEYFNCLTRDDYINLQNAFQTRYAT